MPARRVPRPLPICSCSWLWRVRRDARFGSHWVRDTAAMVHPAGRRCLASASFLAIALFRPRSRGRSAASCAREVQSELLLYVHADIPVPRPSRDRRYCATTYVHMRPPTAACCVHTRSPADIECALTMYRSYQYAVFWL